MARSVTKLCWTALLSMAIASAIPAMSHAEEVTKLNKAGIMALLPTIISKDKSSVQTFDANGQTFYADGRGPSNGSWQVRNDQYCSLWPPSPTWVCYDVELRVDEDGQRHLAWTGDSGTPTITRLTERKAE